MKPGWQRSAWQETVSLPGGGAFFAPQYRIMIICIISILAGGGAAQSPADLPSTPVLAAAPAPDAAALSFLNRCASCHTIGGGAIGTAPDLAASTAWPPADLAVAVKRMEKNVGPLSDAEIAELVDLLKSPDVKERLARARESLTVARRSRLETPSAAKGEALFHGKTALAQGGMACAACHSVEGRGGSLAVDLTDVHTRLGETGLISAAQAANFPVMQAAYAGHPVGEQEAVHLAAYLGAAAARSGAAAAQAGVSLFGPAGAGLGLLALGAFVWRLRRADRPGTRARLVRRATRSHDQ